MIPEITKKILKATKSNGHTWHRGRVTLNHGSKISGGGPFNWTAPGVKTETDDFSCKWSGLDNNDRLLAGLAPLWTDGEPVAAPEGAQRSLVCLDGLWAAVVECSAYTSDDKTRRALNGVCISGVDGYRGAVATDGCRLRFIPGEWGQQGAEAGGDYLIIPGEVIKIAKSLARTLHSVIIYDRQVEVVIPAKPETKYRWSNEISPATPERTEINHIYTIEAQWLTKEGEMFSCIWNATEMAPYPNFRQVVPKSHQTEQLIHCGDLRKALKAAAPLVSKSTQQIHFEPGDAGFEVQYMNLDLGIEAYAVAGAVQSIPQAGNELCPRIGFNLKYLQEAIGKDSDRLLFKFNSAVQAVVVERQLGFNIIMPLRIAD